MTYTATVTAVQSLDHPATERLPRFAGARASQRMGYRWAVHWKLTDDDAPETPIVEDVFYVTDSADDQDIRRELERAARHAVRGRVKRVYIEDVIGMHVTIGADDAERPQLPSQTGRDPAGEMGAGGRPRRPGRRGG